MEICTHTHTFIAKATVLKIETATSHSLPEYESVEVK